MRIEVNNKHNNNYSKERREIAMREILTEFDELQEAMKKINLNEEVMPIYAGKVLINENAESYKKMQQILDCDEMRSAHKYLLNLNPEQMSEEEMDQVDKIF